MASKPLDNVQKTLAMIAGANLRSQSNRQQAEDTNISECQQTSTITASIGSGHWIAIVSPV